MFSNDKQIYSVLVSYITHSHLARSPLGGVIQLGIGWWPVVQLFSHLFCGQAESFVALFYGFPFLIT